MSNEYFCAKTFVGRESPPQEADERRSTSGAKSNVSQPRSS